jgi:hypothetical protein
MRDAHTIVSPARCRARRSGHAAVDRRAWSAANSETTPAADHERAEQRNQATDHRQPGTGAQIGVGQVGGVVVTGVQPDPQAGRGERDLRPRPSGGPPRQGSSRPGFSAGTCSTRTPTPAPRRRSSSRPWPRPPTTGSGCSPWPMPPQPPKSTCGPGKRPGSSTPSSPSRLGFRRPRLLLREVGQVGPGPAAVAGCQRGVGRNRVEGHPVVEEVAVGQGAAVG